MPGSQVHRWRSHPNIILTKPPLFSAFRAAPNNHLNVCAQRYGNRPLQSPSGSSCPCQDRPYLESASVVPLCMSFRHLSLSAQYSRSTPVSEIQQCRSSSRARSWKRLEASWLSFLHTRQPLSGPQQRTRVFGSIAAIPLQDCVAGVVGCH